MTSARSRTLRTCGSQYDDDIHARSESGWARGPEPGRFSMRAKRCYRPGGYGRNDQACYHNQHLASGVIIK